VVACHPPRRCVQNSCIFGPDRSDAGKRWCRSPKGVTCTAGIACQRAGPGSGMPVAAFTSTELSRLQETRGNQACPRATQLPLPGDRHGSGAGRCSRSPDHAAARIAPDAYLEWHATKDSLDGGSVSPVLWPSGQRDIRHGKIQG
jgi:hypothetical protein